MFFNLWLRFGYLFFLSLNDGVVAILDLINFQPSVPQWDCRCYCCCFPPLPIIRAMIAVLGYIPQVLWHHHPNPGWFGLRTPPPPSPGAWPATRPTPPRQTTHPPNIQPHPTPLHSTKYHFGAIGTTKDHFRGALGYFGALARNSMSFVSVVVLITDF